MNETRIEIIARTALVQGPNGQQQVALQVVYQTQGARAEELAFVLLMLEQAKGALFQAVMQQGAPRVVLAGAS